MSFINMILARNPDYIYPLAVNIVAATIPMWAGFKVAKARGRVGLKYPLEYFPGEIDPKTDNEKFLFNCTQRAHQNLMEGFPSFLVIFNICAASFPRFSSVVGIVWAVGRVMYQNGYGSVGPKGRSTGSHISGVAALVLLLGSCFALYKEYVAFI